MGFATPLTRADGPSVPKVQVLQKPWTVVLELVALAELGIEKPLDGMLVIMGGRTDGTQNVELGRGRVGIGRRVKL